MADNASMSVAKAAKKDEFYTQYGDIEAEMNAYVEYDHNVFRDKTILLPCDDPEWSNFTKYFASNFERFGLKKLISTSYARGAANEQITMFEMMSPLFDEKKHEEHGKLFTLTRDADGSGNIDTDDIEFTGYLEGDGDFRSEEVTRLRDEADIIITNPPFSLFREFLAWIMEGGKDFIIIGNQNAISYKEVFPYIENNQMWLGYSIHSGDRKFNVPDDYPLNAAGCGTDEDGRKYIRIKGVRWFTNIDHGWRHEKLELMTMAHNLKFHKQLLDKLQNKYGVSEYPYYDNYNALEIPFTECIPSDYNEMMGAPLTFLDKYNPEQFEIKGITLGNTVDYPMTCIYKNAIQHNKNGSTQGGGKVNTRAAILVDKKPVDTVYYTAENAEGYLLSLFPRILIVPKKGATDK